MSDKREAIDLLNRIEGVLRQLERDPQGTCLSCHQAVSNNGHLVDCPIGQSLVEIEDWRRTPVPGGVDWT